LGIKIQVRSKTHEAIISLYVPFFIKYNAFGELGKKLPKKKENLEIFSEKSEKNFGKHFNNLSFLKPARQVEEGLRKKLETSSQKSKKPQNYGGSGCELLAFGELQIIKIFVNSLRSLTKIITSLVSSLRLKANVFFVKIYSKFLRRNLF